MYNQRYPLFCEGAEYDELWVDPNDKKDLKPDALEALNDLCYKQMKDISIHRRDRNVLEQPKRMRAMLKAAKWNCTTKHGQCVGCY